MDDFEIIKHMTQNLKTNTHKHVKNLNHLLPNLHQFNIQ